MGAPRERVLKNYDLVLHLITCAKGAEFAYDLASNARTDLSSTPARWTSAPLRAWSAHPNLRIIDNDANFNHRSSAPCARSTAPGEVEPMAEKRKYLIAMPDMAAFAARTAPPST